MATELEVQEEFGYLPTEKQSTSEKLKSCTSSTCSRLLSWRFYVNLVPILTWLPNYSLKKDLAGDLVGGITTAIVRIPQSLAYGLLAGLLPINGMYTAFFAPLTYGFLGTSKHVSVGTFAVVSLMLGSAMEKHLYDGGVFTNVNGTEINEMGYEMNAYKLMLITSLTCLIGIVQILMGLFNLGFVTLFLSHPLISGFTTSAALYVFTAQVKYCFGIAVPRQQAPFALVKYYIALFSHISETNFAEIVITIICVSILYPIKIVNIKYKKQLKNIPIPVEVFVVALGTIISAAVNLEDRFGVRIVGEIPSGLPAPIAPRADLWPSLIGDAFSIAVVAFAITVAIGKLFAKKHNYKITPNQELLALGLSQISCSFFSGHACSGALARSSVKESSGTKTQFSDFVSCAVILLVLFCIGPFLRCLPLACLSCIIIVNLRSLFLQFKRPAQLWKICKYDFWTWIVTFLSVFLLGVDTGLALGVIGLLVGVVIRMSQSKPSYHGQLGDSELYQDMQLYKKAQPLPHIKIVQFNQSPFFANKDKYKTMITDIILENAVAAASLNGSSNFSDAEKSQLLLDSDSGCSEGGSPSVNRKFTSTNFNNQNNDEITVDVTSSNDVIITQWVIIDASPWCFIDSVAMEFIKQGCDELTKAGLKCSFACLQPDIVDKLLLVDLLITKDEPDRVPYYPNVHQAVKAAQKTDSGNPLVVEETAASE